MAPQGLRAAIGRLLPELLNDQQATTFSLQRFENLLSSYYL